MLIFIAEVVVRLVNGSTELEGRVEVYYSGEWIRVCNAGWHLEDGDVVCRELGFGPAIAGRYKASFGQGINQIWLSNLNCTGTELSIRNCSHNGWGIKNCHHSEDAVVKCADLNCNFSLIIIISV